MQDVVIASAVRTPMGSFLGTLSPLPAPRLGATAIAGAVDAAGVPREQIDQVLMGNVLQAGLGQAPARQAAIYANLPQGVGAVTVHKVCGSGMRALMDASNGILAGEWNCVVAGGMESMSNAPHLLERSRLGTRMGEIRMTDAMIKDGLWDPYGDKHMGTCAELCAKQYGFTREQQDDYARRSYERAKQAIDSGAFDPEVVAVSVPQPKGEATVVSRDEEPFRAPLEKMGTLRPAFLPEGTITAANASKINDGAAALVVMSRSRAQALQVTPLARVVGYTSWAQEPQWFTTAPVGAIQKLLKTTGLTVADIGVWEINEAFAVVAMAAQRDLDIDPTHLNPRGGAVALGHPIGCSGARIVTTLLHTLVAEKKRYGCAAICIGGGEATALILENEAA